MKKVNGILGLVAGALLVTTGAAQAQDPEIQWDLDDALKQVDRQADDFDTAMARVELVRSDRYGNEMERMEGVAFLNEDGDLRLTQSDPETIHYLMDNFDYS